MEERRFQSGDAVIEEGGPGDFFYVTGSGELEVCVAHRKYLVLNPQRHTNMRNIVVLAFFFHVLCPSNLYRADSAVEISAPGHTGT